MTLQYRKVDSEVFSSIDPFTAYVEEFVSLRERESKEERHQGMLGNRMEEQ
jgi:hypothetical protein